MTETGLIFLNFLPPDPASRPPATSFSLPVLLLVLPALHPPLLPTSAPQTSCPTPATAQLRCSAGGWAAAGTLGLRAPLESARSLGTHALHTPGPCASTPDPFGAEAEERLALDFLAGLACQDGRAPLFTASRRGHSEVVHRLIAARAMVDIADKVLPRALLFLPPVFLPVSLTRSAICYLFFSSLARSFDDAVSVTPPIAAWAVALCGKGNLRGTQAGRR
jgi:hypothetical protein